ncbi:acyl-CoA thioesterase [Virgibacillus siamensis]|uniref:acyl-CoA thioesterase n=1 Tax=Virgibacillus siamensis TaxID=480071 RepID=UPI00111592BD|nr:thioesterase family protein [Virgibacillus siamensis]
MSKIRTPIEVRYQETDQMGVVYHANYLVWFEIGRTKFIESIGLNYASMEKQNVVAPVVDANISFKKPVHYGEDIFVETWIEEYDGLRTEYAYNVINEDDEICVSGTTKHVIVKKDSFRPLSLRRSFPDWHKAYTKNINGEL